MARGFESRNRNTNSKKSNRMIVISLLLSVILLDSVVGAFILTPTNKAENNPSILSSSLVHSKSNIIARNLFSGGKKKGGSNNDSGVGFGEKPKQQAGEGGKQQKEMKDIIDNTPRVPIETTKTTTTKSVLDIPASAIKVGPLKFFLQIYIVSEQNNPVKGSWTLNVNEAKNNNDEEYKAGMSASSTLDIYYLDGSGMFSVVVNEKNISIIRHGARPSLQYMLQESVMLHGVLDELEKTACENDDGKGNIIPKEKRLLQFDCEDTDDAIAKVLNKAREKLPAKKA